MNCIKVFKEHNVRLCLHQTFIETIKTTGKKFYSEHKHTLWPFQVAFSIFLLMLSLHPHIPYSCGRAPAQIRGLYFHFMPASENHFFTPP